MKNSERKDKGHRSVVIFAIRVLQNLASAVGKIPICWSFVIVSNVCLSGILAISQSYTCIEE